MRRLRPIIAGAVLVASVVGCSSTSTPAASTPTTSSVIDSTSSSVGDLPTPLPASTPVVENPATTSSERASSIESSAPNSSGEDPRDAAYEKALRDRGWAPAISDADLVGTVTDAQSVCDEMQGSETDAQKQLGIQGNAMLTVSTYGVDQSTANKIMIFSAHTYCPEYESTVAGYLDPTVFRPTS